MTKLISLVAGGALVLALAACSGSGSDTDGAALAQEACDQYSTMVADLMNGDLVTEEDTYQRIEAIEETAADADEEVATAARQLLEAASAESRVQVSVASGDMEAACAAIAVE